jgi:PKD repeat protein
MNEMPETHVKFFGFAESLTMGISEINQYSATLHLGRAVLSPLKTSPKVIESDISEPTPILIHKGKESILRDVGRILIFIMVFQLVTLSISQNLVTKAGTAETRTIRIISDSTGLNHTTVGKPSEAIPAGGVPFTTRIVLDGPTNKLWTWQVAISFDNNSIRCTNIQIPENDSSYVFYGKNEYSAVDFKNETQDGKYGPPAGVIAGAALFDISQSVNVSNALLCIMTWTALKTGNYNLTFIQRSYTYLIDSSNLNIPIATADFSLSVVGAVSKPVATFTASPQNPRANDTVTFDASKSYDPNRQTITAYDWDFGDNTTATELTSAMTAHTYLNDGPYEVNLTVTTTDGRTGSTAGELQVGSIPTATFTYLVNGIPSSKILPNTDEVTFNASESTAPDGTIVIYRWDFGDNSTFTSSDAIALHKFLVRGVYNVSLMVVDNNGLHDTETASLQVGNPPTASFTWAPTSPVVGETVSFSASSTAELGTSIARYRWDFGEGLKAQETSSLTTNHIYVSEGNWTCDLTVYDTDGLHASYDKTITVEFSAVRDLTTQKTLIGRGYNDSLSVTLQIPWYVFIATGNVNETIDLTFYANSTIISSESILLEQSNWTDVLPLRITWNPEGFAYGDYTLSAQAIVRGPGNMNSSTLCDVPVHVGVPGDINNDNTVNMKDVNKAVYSFNSRSGTYRWDSNADVDGNGRIDMRDILIIVLNFNGHE